MSAAKRQKTHPTYELLYHPGIPGRGEYIRLALEAAGASYTDPANEDPEHGKPKVYSLLSPTLTSDDDGNAPIFAPPALRIAGAGKDDKSLLLSQTPAILLYLGDNLNLAPTEDEVPGGKYVVHSLALTALDVCNEAHDTHHPVSVAQYYEEQKEAALAKAEEFREKRLPKYLGFFERVLKGNEEKGKGKYLVGGRLSYADTTVWQSLDGILYAFPKQLAALKPKYPTLFETFYPSLKEEKGIQEYLSSKRRLSYGDGIYRHYPELDKQE